MYKHILVSTDGSELALKGIEQAMALALEISAKVTIITVSQPYPLQSAATQDSWNTAQQKFVEDALQSANEVAKKYGVEATSRQEVSVSAAEAIVKTAGTLGCDLIVMASHGRRGVSRLLLGSQTAEVVSSSPIPVLVVR